jgi:hypothetical protein
LIDGFALPDAKQDVILQTTEWLTELRKGNCVGRSMIEKCAKEMGFVGAKCEKELRSKNGTQTAIICEMAITIGTLVTMKSKS